MKIERPYKGIALVVGGIAFGGQITWNIISQMEETEANEQYIESDGKNLTIFTDETMTNEYCTYTYNKEFDVYYSNNDDKLEQIVKIFDIDRISFFQIEPLKDLVKEHPFYVCLHIEIDGDPEKKIILVDMECNINDFPNTIEDFSEYLFDKDVDLMLKDNKKAKFFMTIRTEKGSSVGLTQFIEI